MGSGCRKFRLLLWKNYVLQKRHKIQTVFEIFLPLFFTMMLLYVRLVVETSEFKTESYYPEFNPADPMGTFVFGGRYVLYAPNTPEVAKIVDTVNESLGDLKVSIEEIEKLLEGTGKELPEDVKDLINAQGINELSLEALAQLTGEGVPQFAFRPYNTEKAMVDAYLNHKDYAERESIPFRVNSNPVLAAIVFKTNPLKANKITYHIRFPATHHGAHPKQFPTPKWWTHSLYPTFQVLGPREQVQNESSPSLGKPKNAIMQLRQTGVSLGAQNLLAKGQKEDLVKLAIKKNNERGGIPGYWQQGFLFLQAALDAAVICERAGTEKCIELTTQFQLRLNRFPYPTYTEDQFVTMIPTYFAFFLVLGYLYSTVNIAKSIAHEKERRLKESMKMMGLPNWLHLCAWFTKSFLFLLISTILMTVVMKVKWKNNVSIITFSDGSLLFFFLMCYVFSIISFSFLIASFFSTANSASTVAGVVFFLTFFPYMFLQLRYNDLSKALKVGMSIFCNTAMGFGCQIITMFEGTAAGIQWATIAEGVGPDDDFTMLDIILMLLADGVIYLLLAIYVEGVFPGDYGVPLPWYFPVTKWYWTGGVRGVSKEGMKVHPQSSALDNDDSFEKEPEGGHAGIRIMSLKKVFGEKVAVDDLCLNFYEGQVTALLGHNGAGKTTTMSMITGLFPPTSGTVLVNDFDIRVDIQAVRESLGLCPQHDVLFDELTVEEHLEFFCLLKGYNKYLAKEEVNRMLEALMMPQKKKAQSRTLSGGMKRKLSVGIALIGGSKVVLLDEPTSGMDPGARRSTWNLISSEKKERTIVLSTHFMDEADLLGDRIAIMAHGRVICCGSSLFLKRKYGGGYHLIMVKAPNCKEDLVTQLIQKHIPEVNIDQNIGTELSYSLPDAKASIFPALFAELETRKNELGILSYGCSITQMEEVFMRVGQIEEKRLSAAAGDTPGENKTAKPPVPVVVTKDETTTGDGVPIKRTKKEKNKDNAGIADTDGEVSEGPSSSSPTMDSESELLNRSSKDLRAEHGASAIRLGEYYDRNEGCRLFFQQLKGMLVKKCIYAKRNKLLLTIQGFVPVLFFIIVLILLKTYPGFSGGVQMDLTLEKYSKFTKPVTAIDCAPNLQDICTSYKATVGSLSSVVGTKRKRLEHFILAESAKSLPRVNSRYLIGLKASVEDYGRTKLNGFFNNQPYHTPPVALNMLSNTLLRKLTGNPKLWLTVSNQPLPYRSKEKVESLSQAIAQGFHIGFNIAFGMSFLAASFVVFLIKERACNSKHLQFVSGVKFPIFWLAHWIFDVIYFIIPCLVLVIVLVSFRLEHFSNSKTVLLFFLVLLMYGWAALPLMYLFSFLFTVPSSGYTRMTFFNIMTGTAPVLVVTILNLPSLDLSDVAGYLEAIFSLLPNFNLGFALQQIVLNYNFHVHCPSVPAKICDYDPKFPCCTKYPIDYMGWNPPGIGRNLTFLIIIGLLCHIILYTIESKIFAKITCRKKKVVLPTEDPSTLEDSDVAAENDRIRKGNILDLCLENNMVLLNLTKFYGKFLAVDRLCLGVEHGECFGLLGVNGAGKTTTFKMLTGDHSITMGDAFITGNSVKTHIKDVQKLIGYCPQFDALIPELTGRETIRLFARARGILESEINTLVDALAADLLFTEHIEKPCGTYSGGNKRKLSTAITLIGNPPVVFLDEPTTGMDPVARRHLWNTIIKVRERGTSVILTSHSMEECEALCTRLAIMVNGKFRCLGSTQHLKNKFGDGYTLIAQMQSIEESEEKRLTRTSLEAGRRRESLKSTAEQWELNLQPLRNYIEENFPDCQLKDMHPCYVHYHIPMKGAISWGEMFTMMEVAKSKFHLEAYSIGQTSLEQVFLGFTKGQCNDD